MDQATLLYDAKCQICRNLALKVQTHARKPLAIVALTDPEASRMLEKFYPDGWDHDFYLLENGSCRKGISAVPKLVRTLGAKKFGSLLAEYASFRLARQTCDTKAKKHDHGSSDGNGHHHDVPTRRRVLAYAAAAPLLALSKVPKLTDPFEPGGGREEKLPDLSVNLAVVWRDDSGHLHAQVRSLKNAVRSESGFTKKSTNSKIVGRDHKILEQSPNFGGEPRVGVLAAREPQFALKMSHMDVDAEGEKRFMDTWGYAADYGRFSVTLNLGNSTVGTPRGTEVAATMSGMIRHDMALPMVDVVAFVGTEDALTQIQGYTVGVRALRDFHAQAGRSRVAELYASVEEGVAGAVDVYRRNLTEVLSPVKSKLVISSMPELMQFVDVQSELQRIRGEILSTRIGTNAGGDAAIAIQGGCDCSCSCDCCCGCGCGCGCGFCGCMCICECCCSCGCSCGCGCCAGGGSTEVIV